MARPDGYVSVEGVALAALRETVAAGKVTREAAEIINARAFSGAQLDSNLGAPYDSRGSESDPTMAVSDIERALISMRTVMKKLRTKS